MTQRLQLATIITELGVNTKPLARGAKEHKKFTDKLARQTKKASKPLDNFNRGFKQSIPAIARWGVGLGVAAVALNKLGKELSESVRAFAKWESQMILTEQLVKTTGKAAGFTANELAVMSRKIGRETLASSQEVLKAANSLQTFRAISGDVFKDALESAQDLAALGFGNIRQTAVQLGKALEDPKIGMSALTRVGVTFSQQQKDRIKQLQEENKLLEAQGILLGAVKAQSAGAGKAAAKGTAGLFDTLAEETTLFKEQVGKIIAESDAFRGAISWMTSGVRSAAEYLDRTFGTGELSMTNMSRSELSKRRTELQNRQNGWFSQIMTPFQTMNELGEIQTINRHLAGRRAASAAKRTRSRTWMADAAWERSGEAGIGTMQDPDPTPMGARFSYPSERTTIGRTPKPVIGSKYWVDYQREKMTTHANKFKDGNEKEIEAESNHGEKMMSLLQKRMQNSEQLWDQHNENVQRKQRHQSMALESIGMGTWNSILGFQKAGIEEQKNAFSGQMQIFGNALQQMSGLSKKNFENFKKLQYAQAVISGIAAAIHSYNFGTQYGGPIGGIAAAAASAAATGLQLAQINAQKFEGRRAGGATRAGRTYEINEAGPEMFTVNGKDYLTAGQSGRMTPASKVKGSNQNEVKLIVHYDPRVTEIKERKNNDGSIEMTVESLENIMADRIRSGKSYLTQSLGGRI